ncbi:SRPBCC domain-containing protein [Paenibacillus protaetiae]|uniref:SRPBCC domain-containing protein n=1 Tax=Paenibacillus protaetiae TaxID=2509456 RepID=A0A4P6EY94_9BACL|nr:SRPBCC domain-containing protein [Paenibacillus protaetiae]QAY67223.1 SRPBCC domain-containing protein [Paenibacillus protaetiae]
MFKKKGISQITAKAKGQDLILERVFDAPKEAVFRAYKEADQLVRWWGPNGWTLTHCSVDFRPGGSWHYCMSQDGGEMASWGKAVYNEIEEPDKIVYNDYFSDEEGGINPDMQQLLITLTFETKGKMTKLINRAHFASPEALKSTLEMGLVQGMSQTWDRLAAHLKETAAGK